MYTYEFDIAKTNHYFIAAVFGLRTIHNNNKRQAVGRAAEGDKQTPNVTAKCHHMAGSMSSSVYCIGSKGGSPGTFLP